MLYTWWSSLGASAEVFFGFFLCLVGFFLCLVPVMASSLKYSIPLLPGVIFSRKGRRRKEDHVILTGRFSRTFFWLFFCALFLSWLALSNIPVYIVSHCKMYWYESIYGKFYRGYLFDIDHRPLKLRQITNHRA